MNLPATYTREEPQVDVEEVAIRETVKGWVTLKVVSAIFLLVCF